MVVKTYRGLLANNAQERIPLATKDGSVGYRIVKLDIMTNNPGTQDFETVIKIYKKEQSLATADMDFTDNTLLGAATASGDATSNNFPTHITVIFDSEVFNQDIYITHVSLLSPNPACNFYLELEQMKLDHTQNMSATLKAIRGAAVD